MITSAVFDDNLSRQPSLRQSLMVVLFSKEPFAVAFGKKYYGRLTGSLTSYGNQIDKTEMQLKSVKNAKLLPEHEEQREERIKSLEKALEAYKKTKNQWMEKIGTLASSLEEGLEEETANAKVENVQNLQKELEGEVAALRKNLQAQKQLWSQIPQSA